MHIRKATNKDAPSVKKLITHVLEGEYHASHKVFGTGDLDDIHASYGSKGEVFFVAEEDNGVVGTVGIKKEDEHTALLRRLFVESGVRGKGYGLKLIEAGIDFCKHAGYQKIIFRATRDMKAALGACEKKGFKLFHHFVFDGCEMVKLIYML